MMRMNRAQWFSKWYKPLFGKAQAPRPRKPKPPSLHVFEFVIEGARVPIEAPTRSEARARLKRQLKVKRLPVGA